MKKNLAKKPSLQKAGVLDIEVMIMEGEAQPAKNLGYTNCPLQRNVITAIDVMKEQENIRSRSAVIERLFNFYYTYKEKENRMLEYSKDRVMERITELEVRVQKIQETSDVMFKIISERKRVQ